MAKRKQKGGDTAPVDDQTRPLDRIAKLLAILAVKGENQTDKIVTLAAVGFTHTEVSQLLGTTPNTVAVTVYQHNKKKLKPGPRIRRTG
jgi:hypothetical protein